MNINILIYILITTIISPPINQTEPEELFYYEQSIVIEKPVNEVWEYLDDLDNCTDYLFFLKDVSKIPEGPNSIKTEFTFYFNFLFKKYTNSYKMVKYKPPYTFSFETVDGAEIGAHGSVALNGIDNTSTELTIIYSPEVSRFFSIFSNAQVDFIYNQTLTRVLSQIKKNVT